MYPTTAIPYSESTLHQDVSEQPPLLFTDQIRAAASAPSPISRVLVNSRLMRSLAERPKPKRASHSDSFISADAGLAMASTSKGGSSGHGHVHPIAALEATERHSMKLKTLLLDAGRRLEDEMERSNGIENKLEKAIARIKYTEIQVATCEMARIDAEQSAAKANAELQMLRARFEHAQRELTRAQTAIDDLAKSRDRAIESARRSQSTLREYELALREAEGWQNGVAQGRKEAYISSWRRGVRPTSHKMGAQRRTGLGGYGERNEAHEGEGPLEHQEPADWESGIKVTVDGVDNEQDIGTGTGSETAADGGD